MCISSDIANQKQSNINQIKRSDVCFVDLSNKFLAYHNKANKGEGKEKAKEQQAVAL